MKLKSLFSAAALLPFCLTGCVTFHAKPLAPEKSAAAFEARSLSAPELRAFIDHNRGQATAWPPDPVSLGRGSSSTNASEGWPPEAWDLSLLTLAAFYYHPDLDIARAQWAVAKAGQKTAGERPNPTLNLPEEWASNPAAGVSPWIVGAALDIPIETAGKRGYRLQQSRALSEAARLHIARVAWQVRGRVRTSLLALYAAQKMEEILQAQQEQMNQNRILFERRAAGGFVSPLALTQAQVLAGKTSVALAEAQRQELAARGQLADAIGVSRQALAGVRFSLEGLDHPSSIEDPMFAQLREQALRSRSDLLESLANYAASQSALQLEVAKQYPDIHLGPGFLFDQGTHKWGLAGASVLPIFNQNHGPIAEASARREEAAVRFLALQEQVIGEIDRAIADYHATRRKLDTANALLETHLKQDRALQRLLHPGDLSRLTLFRAQLDIDSTRLIASDALVQFHQAEGVLEDALERPLSGSGQPIPSLEIDPRLGPSSPPSPASSGRRGAAEASHVK